MIKIPATSEGLPAIEQMIAEGRNVNVTLIFSLERHQEVMDAYVRGLERLAADPTADLSGVASVASFFISRVDVEVDRRLDHLGSDRAQALRGRAAVAQARLAYERFERTFSGPVWDALAARGARVQRPLWASTGRKNPAYSDVMYVDELIGPHTVNTLPEETLEAFDDHGRLGRTIDLADAAEVWAELTDIGVDLDDVAQRLEHDGVAAFMASFDDLLGTLGAKAVELASD
jgi:transaldolase